MTRATRTLRCTAFTTKTTTLSSLTCKLSTTARGYARSRRSKAWKRAEALRKRKLRKGRRRSTQKVPAMLGEASRALSCSSHGCRTAASRHRCRPAEDDCRLISAITRHLQLKSGLVERISSIELATQPYARSCSTTIRKSEAPTRKTPRRRNPLHRKHLPVIGMWGFSTRNTFHQLAKLLQKHPIYPFRAYET